MTIFELKEEKPSIAQSAYVSTAATIIGDVLIADNSSVWPGAVISRLRKYRPALLSHELDQNFRRGISHSLEYGPVNFGFRTCL
jgi:hypothetical protein